MPADTTPAIAPPATSDVGDDLTVQTTERGTAWFQDGKVHRDGAPAIVHANGTEEWYQNGVRHRADGPAITNPDGTEKWYLDGVLHRDDGPAATTPNGPRRWYRHGQLHREDGPAYEYHSSQRLPDVYYVVGLPLSVEQFETFLVLDPPARRLAVALLAGGVGVRQSLEFAPLFAPTTDDPATPDPGWQAINAAQASLPIRLTRGEHGETLSRGALTGTYVPAAPDELELELLL